MRRFTFHFPGSKQKIHLVEVDFCSSMKLD